MPALRYFFVASLVLVLALTAAVVSLNLGTSRPVYEWIGRAALNRDIHIEGPISLRIGSVTTLSLNNITVAGTSEGTPAFATIGALVAQVSLFSLWDDALVVPSASVDDLKVFIDIDEAGQGNWPTLSGGDLTAEDPSEAKLPYALRATDLRIERAMLRVWDARSNQEHTLFIETLHETLIEDTLQLRSRGSLNTSPFGTTVMVEGVASLLDIRDWQVHWEGSLGDAEFELSTAVTSIDELFGSDIDLTIHSDSAQNLLQSLNLPTFSGGPADVALQSRQQDDRRVVNLIGRLGELRVTGSADQPLDSSLESGNIVLSASGPSLSQVGTLLDAQGFPATPFAIDIEASLEGQGVTVEELQLTSEAITLSLSGTLPGYRSLDAGRLSGDIDIPDLNAFSGLLDPTKPLQGSLSGTVSLARDADGTDIVVTSTSPLLTLTLNGRLTPEPGFSGSAVQFSGRSATPGQWLGLLMEIPPPLSPIDFAGKATLSAPETIAVESLTVRAGNDVVSAQGMIGWAEATEKTAISVTARSQNLQETLAPWVSQTEFLLDLPAVAEAQLAFTSPDLMKIERAMLSVDQNVAAFAGDISLQNTEPSISGFLDVSVPVFQTLFPALAVPQRYERPLNFSGDVVWTPGVIALDVADNRLRYGSITADGHLSLDLLEGTAGFDLHASTPDARDYLPAAERGSDTPPMPMTATVTGGWNAHHVRVEALRINSAELQIDSAGLLELSSEAFSNSHLDAVVSIARMGLLKEWLDFPFPDQNLEITADIDSREGALVVDTLTLLSGESDLSVKGTAVRASGLQLNLDVSARHLNLDPWILARREEDGAVPEQDTGSTDNQRVLPDYPTSTAWLRDVVVNTELSIAEFIGLPRPVFNVRGELNISEQGIVIPHLSAENERSGGATLTGSLLSNQGAAPQLDIAIEGINLVMGIPKAPSEDVDSLPSYEFKSKLTGAGNTTRELASSLEGYLNVVMGSGKVLNAGFDRLTNSFLQELTQVLNPLQSQRDVTAINCAAAFVTSEAGKLSGKPAVVVDTPDVKMFSNVTLDLGAERIKAKFKTVPQKGLGLSVSSVINPYVEVSGTLSDPKIMVDPANTVVGGSLAVMTGGLSILAQNVVERMSASGNICAARLSKANEEMSTLDDQR